MRIDRRSADERDEPSTQGSRADEPEGQVSTEPRTVTLARAVPHVAKEHALEHRRALARRRARRTPHRNGMIRTVGLSAPEKGFPRPRLRVDARVAYSVVGGAVVAEHVHLEARALPRPIAAHPAIDGRAHAALQHHVRRESAREVDEPLALGHRGWLRHRRPLGTGWRTGVEGRIEC